MSLMVIPKYGGTKRKVLIAGTVSVQAVRPWRLLLTAAACPAIVDDPLGLSHWLLWEPASRFPFEPWTPGASPAAWLFSQKVHYTPHSPSPFIP